MTVTPVWRETAVLDRNSENTCGIGNGRVKKAMEHSSKRFNNIKLEVFNMSEHRKTNLAQGRNCMVEKCSCGAFHLHYKYVMISIPAGVLFQIMLKCYRWEELVRDKESYSKEAFKIIFGEVLLNISPEDFQDFNDTVQAATKKEMNIDEMLYTTENIRK